ncbi:MULTISPECIES: Rossmann-like and DUF2520 domain-containing protein [Flavobacterium]|uniref:DUF2520 domain-containing protein n=1 Tax=Flavobacterium gawalongense TaxID=2594432 RepID=A0A553BIS7_9FLAO|nr:Rossmann-like and DUF2520 domain-containing protein [Flavobacterium gawalongense]TRX00060.1 DUF2520 domain-containing protein [Flavobacterium gawalongense]TRX04847.1 DUF2520 domain-containing protein [Flavobacterium gawalongense]TRX08158.1 DUF2520 domain-containing protein [Flavobacterium gawalongense]TRX08732.1 DUF2520 domain-containing protein [Flavobacterium gawalongense]TRX24660.1 DUF2520 domain-containing protein [Flavobacterium gawalongense]
MIKVIIIGSGNVAQHLIAAFQNSQNLGTEIELVQVFSRQIGSVSHLLDLDHITNDFDTLTEADLYIIAVSDDAIAAISSKLPFKNRLVVHTSGSVPLNALDDNNRKGVFYPLQTFTKNKAVDFKIIPICLESENATDFQLLEKVAKAISDKIFAINSEQRKALHVAAVFVNNFVNHLYQIGNEICQEHQVPFEILKPLISETTQKIMVLSPSAAQTGPAKRNDIKTIQAHEAFLSNEDHLKIYKTLTQSIQHNGKKL